VLRYVVGVTFEINPEDEGIIMFRNIEKYKSYRNYQQDAPVYDNLLFHCALIAEHVSSVIIAHLQELLNCNCSFWFYSLLSLPAA
jgi:hypothetical protein